MNYERLTVKDIRTGKCERVGDPTTSAVYYINDRFGKFSLDEEVKTKRISFKEAYNRLAELEDKIESGLLVELPCKVGDRVYAIFQDYAHKNDYAFFKEKVDEIRIIGKDIYICLSCGEEFHEERNADQFGVTLFTTKEAAEAKLKELRGER